MCFECIIGVKMTLKMKYTHPPRGKWALSLALTPQKFFLFLVFLNCKFRLIVKIYSLIVNDCYFA